MRHFSYALLLLQLSFAAAAAGTSTELQNLYNALNMLNQQQQAIYQQFQMVQELRRGSAPRIDGMPARPQRLGQIPNYDEEIEAQENAALHEEQLSQQADQLLARYNEIEELKNPLQRRIYDLSLRK